MFRAGFEPATLCVWGTRDNRYTNETWLEVPLPKVDQSWKIALDPKEAPPGGLEPPTFNIKYLFRIKNTKYIKTGKFLDNTHNSCIAVSIASYSFLVYKFDFLLQTSKLSSLKWFDINKNKSLDT